MGGTDLRIVNRIAFVSGLVTIAIGMLGTLGGLVVIWQAESNLGDIGGIFTSGRSGRESASLADRITIAFQFGGSVLLFAVLLVAVGVALCVAAAHLPDSRASAPALPERPEPPVIEVPLELEDRAWAPVAPRPDEDLLRP